MYVSVGHPTYGDMGTGMLQEMSLRTVGAHSLITIKNVVSSGGKSISRLRDRAEAESRNIKSFLLMEY